MTRSSFGGSLVQAHHRWPWPHDGLRCTSTLRTPSGAREGSQAVSLAAPLNQAGEIRALRAHNEQLQRQLALKDQGLGASKGAWSALMLSPQAADAATRREAGSIIGELEKENAKLRADLHTNSQLHSAVAHRRSSRASTI